MCKILVVYETAFLDRPSLCSTSKTAIGAMPLDPQWHSAISRLPHTPQDSDSQKNRDAVRMSKRLYAMLLLGWLLAMQVVVGRDDKFVKHGKEKSGLHTGARPHVVYRIEDKWATHAPMYSTPTQVQMTDEGKYYEDDDAFEPTEPVEKDATALSDSGSALEDVVQFPSESLGDEDESNGSGSENLASIDQDTSRDDIFSDFRKSLEEADKTLDETSNTTDLNDGTLNEDTNGLIDDLPVIPDEADSSSKESSSPVVEKPVASVVALIAVIVAIF